MTKFSECKMIIDILKISHFWKVTRVVPVSVCFPRIAYQRKRLSRFIRRTRPTHALQIRQVSGIKLVQKLSGERWMALKSFKDGRGLRSRFGVPNTEGPFACFPANLERLRVHARSARSSLSFFEHQDNCTRQKIYYIYQPVAKLARTPLAPATWLFPGWQFNAPGFLISHDRDFSYSNFDTNDVSTTYTYSFTVHTSSDLHHSVIYTFITLPNVCIFFFFFLYEDNPDRIALRN